MSDCPTCSAELPAAAKFCGSCGTRLGGAAVPSAAPAAAADSGSSGAPLSVFDQTALAQKNQHVARDSKFAGAAPARGYVGSFGEEQRKKAQAEMGTSGRDHKFAGSKPTTGYVGSFGDEQRKKAQAEMSTTGRDHKFAGSKPTTGYVGSFGEEQRKKAQAEMGTSGRDHKFAGSKPTTGYVGSFGEEQRKAAQAAMGTTGRDKFAGAGPMVGTGLTLMDEEHLRSQKMVSEAKASGTDLIIMSQEKPVGTGLSFVDEKALEHQKLGSSAFIASDKIVTPGASVAGAAPVGAAGFCHECGTPRVAGASFCGECGQAV